MIGNQGAIGQPHAAPSAEFAKDRGEFHLELSVIMPDTVDASAVNHFVFTKQAAIFIPLTAEAVGQVGFEGFFVGKGAVLVPSADNTLPQAIF